MKKIFLLIILTICLTGCEAKYSLEYIDNNYNETFLVEVDETNKQEINDYYNKNILVDFNIDPGDLENSEYDKFYECYNKNLIGSNLELSYKYEDKESYKNSTLVNSLFRNIRVEERNISLSSIKNIFADYVNLEEIIINFKTDKVVESSNADEIKDGMYLWYINKDNYKTKSINIDLSTREKSMIENIDISNYSYIIFISLGVILFISVIVIIVKVKTSNKK